MRQSRRIVLALLATLVFAVPSHPAFAAPPPASPPAAAAAEADHAHDFDFEFGTWKTHLRLLVKRLAGSNTWADLEGTSVVRKVWDGRANLGELKVDNATTHIQGISLRLYNPQSREWYIHWANAKDGTLGPAMVGKFTNGRGEFYNQEMFDGKAAFVRFIFSDVTANSFQLEQAYSTDGGKTWEPNWIATFTRQGP